MRSNNYLDDLIKVKEAILKFDVIYRDINLNRYKNLKIYMWFNHLY